MFNPKNINALLGTKRKFYDYSSISNNTNATSNKSTSEPTDDIHKKAKTEEKLTELGQQFNTALDLQLEKCINELKQRTQYLPNPEGFTVLGKTIIRDFIHFRNKLKRDEGINVSTAFIEKKYIPLIAAYMDYESSKSIRPKNLDKYKDNKLSLYNYPLHIIPEGYVGGIDPPDDKEFETEDITEPTEIEKNIVNSIPFFPGS